MKRVVCLSVLSFFVFSLTGSSLANDMCGAAKHEDASKTAPAGNKSEPVNVGNKICPVMGEKIDEKSKATYDYKGKTYDFCCPGCIDTFKKDPDKYIKKVCEEKGKGKNSCDEKQGAKKESGSSTHESHQH